MWHQKNLSLVSVVILASALFISYALVARALSKSDIVFPVAELGGCKNESDCRAFCDKRDSLENIKACIAFAKKYNLLPADEIAKAEKFASLAAKGGPGGCNNEKDCVAYCENGAHIDECLAFAEKTGFLPPDQLAEAKKFSTFIKSGETPGGCKSKAGCVAYCADGNHSEECVSFLEKAGFMTQKEAGLIRKFKGKSPGDCARGATSFAEGQKACNAFCNDPTNQPVCFRFLEEAGIMTAEEATQAGSLSDFQACVPSAPQEIQQCFINNLGQDLFDAMKQGALPLQGDIEGFMLKIRAARQCVNRYADQSLATLTSNPDALACISSELGKDYLEKAKRGEVKCGDAAQSQKRVESCIETAISAKLDHCFALACSEATTCLKSFENTGNGKKGQVNPDLNARINDKLNGCVAEQINTCLSKDCSEAIACFQSLQGSGGKQQGESKLDPALRQKINAKMSGCNKQPKGGQQNQQPPQGNQPQQQQQAPSGGSPSSEQQQIPQSYCSSFASTPSCSYVGAPDSQNYKYCKQCFPDK